MQKYYQTKFPKKNEIKFGEFWEECNKFHSIMLKNCNWKYLSPTIYFLLAYGPAVVKYFNDYIGETTEESQGKTNKDIRTACLNHSKKKTIREANIEDIAHWLLQKSDPILNEEIVN